MIDKLQPVAAPRTVQFSDGGIGGLAVGAVIAVCVALFAYLPLILVLAVMGLGPNKDALDGSHLLGVIFWAGCMSLPVWVCAQHAVRTAITVDAAGGIVESVTTNYFLVSHIRRFRLDEIADARLDEPDWETTLLTPLARPVLVLKSGAIVPLATQVYTSASPKLDAARLQQAEQLIEDVRALLRRSAATA